jgi:inner membrane protein
MPTLGNNIVWRSFYLAAGHIYSDRIRVGWFGAESHRTGTSLPLATSHALTQFEREANERTRGFERFAWFSQGWVARSPLDATVLGDMRYSLSADAFDPVWGIRFSSTTNGVRVEWVSRERERRPELRKLWSEILGN